MSHSEIENYLTNYHINENNFDKIALDIFRFQYITCSIYRQFVDALKVDVSQINTIEKIPFLPVSFFKTHEVVSGKLQQKDIEIEFHSSGTSGADTSKHFVLRKEIYQNNLINNFMEFYAHPSEYIFIGLLPSYLERGQSSLVYMCHELMQKSGQNEELFFLNDYENLFHLLNSWTDFKKPFIIGVTYALLDFAELYPMDLSNAIIMETGGMKGRKKEMTRGEVHDILKKQFNTEAIHSEYGMTELLSQAYSFRDGIYYSPKTQKILFRDQYNPLNVSQIGSGLINVIDLANLYSCSFIATDDIGAGKGSLNFEVLGRADHSVLRGCSLLNL